MTSFQAGSRSCTYDMLPAVEDLSASKMQLVAPARMLYGEVMIPVYSKDINPQEKILFNWLGGWDEETKTMTLPMKTPWRYSAVKEWGAGQHGLRPILSKNKKF